LCLDEETKKLVSFAFTYANDESTKFHSMSRVGPEGGVCLDLQLSDDRGFPARSYIYRDLERVESLVLITEELSVVQMGIKSGDQEK